MADLNDVDMEQMNLPNGGFGYTAAKLDTLTAAEYTLCPLALDESGSTSQFSAAIEKGCAEIIKACRRSPRADNLMMRATAFGSRVREIEGFKPLTTYGSTNGWYRSGGSTALFDAIIEQIRATRDYAKQLYSRDYLINMIGFVITDGDDSGQYGGSILGKDDVKREIEALVKDEILESGLMCLIGVNITDPNISQKLQELQRDAGFVRYIELDGADEKSIAKLVNFVSQSISSQSQHLGSGGPSQAINSLTI